MTASEAPVRLDVQLLSRASSADVVEYLRDQLRLHPEPAVRRSVLHFITIDAVPPTISRIWLETAREPDTLREALHQNHSALLRSQAIRRLASVLRGTHWRATWDALGSTEGIAQLLSRFSVCHIRQATKAIGRNVKGIDAHHKAQKRQAISELLLHLVPSIRSSSYQASTQAGSSPEKRDLIKAYADLLPACTPELVHRVLFDAAHGVPLHGPQATLLREHHQVFLDRASQPGSNIFESNWADHASHRLEVVYAVVFPAAGQHDFGSVKPFLSLALSSLVKQLPTSSNSLRRVRQKYAGPLSNLLHRLVACPHWSLHDRRAAFDLILDTLQTHSKDHYTIRNVLWEQAAQLWAESPELFQPVLLRALNMASRSPRYLCFSQVQSSVPSIKRWELLKLIQRSDPVCPIDLDQDAGLKELLTHRNAKRWSFGIFQALPPQQALKLLERLAVHLPRDELISMGGTSGYSILGVGSEHGYLDFDMARFELDPSVDAQERSKCSNDAIEERKRKIANSSDPDDRETLARQALCWATCSRSYELYTNTVVWMRRFVRDVHVARSIFTAWAIHTKEATSLLSGIPQRPDASLTVDTVRNDIVQANRAIWEWFELVRAAAPEPSFKASDFTGASLIILVVVIERMRRIERLQACLGLDADQISALVWDDTVSLLIRIEEICIDPAFRRLELYDIAGPLAMRANNYARSLPGIHVRTIAGLSFVEKLHAARDALWKSHRISLNPSVASLPRGVPHGLPLHVAPVMWNLDQVLPQAAASPLLRTARSIVFAEPQTAMQPLPDDEETLDAIGGHHEDWAFALLLLLKAEQGKAAKLQLMREAWLHATRKLADSRLSRDEAETWWLTEVFEPAARKKMFPNPRKFAQCAPALQLPDALAPDAVTWAPNALLVQAPKRSQKAPMTVLDTIIGQDVLGGLQDGSLCRSASASENRSWNRSDALEKRRQAVQALKAGIVGSGPRNQPRETVRSFVEAHAALRLLLLDHNCPDGDTLELPFPSQNQVRYPQLVLSEAFLKTPESKLGLDQDVRQWLMPVVSIAPPSLLRRLAERALAARADGRLPKTSRLALDLVLCLQAGDRPREALPLVLKIVLENRDDSSWHRILFSKGYLERLCAQDARDAVQGLAREILARTGVPSTQPNTDGPSIKVSTVKLLAQAMEGAEYVAPSDAIEILMQLLDRAKHADIRHAALEALLASVCGRPSTSDAASTALRDGLQRLVPILAALDETRPEESALPWAEGALPHICEGPATARKDVVGMRQLPRTWELVMNALSTYKAWAAVLMQTVVVPAIEQSIELHRRWLDRFLREHDASIESVALPVPPVKVQILKRLVREHAYLTPDWMVQLYCDYLRALVSPTAKVREINRALKERQDNAARHWLAAYETPAVSSSSHDWQLGSLPFLSPFVKSLVEGAPEDVDVVEMVRSHAESIDAASRAVLEAMEIVLEVKRVDLAALRYLLQALAPPPRKSARIAVAQMRAWTRCVRPILAEMVERIDALRTPAWQRNPERRPARLPSTLEYRLWLLPYPSCDEAEGATKLAQQCREFGQALGEHIEMLVAQAVPCHEEMERLHQAAMGCPAKQRGLIATAVGVWHGEELPDATSRMLVRSHCIDLAAKLVFAAELPGESEAWLGELKSMVEGWARSEVEWIRERAQRLAVPDLDFLEYADAAIGDVVRAVVPHEEEPDELEIW
ncbi:uncharacterized protein PAN0_031c6229 [Moesziomyces antarcticus]|uniref:Uncharacterized protein n=2 Tax=Pseudozyma antarctica TaxID=84753 RepID=A0A081CMV3_PSEA2|nr:uncharacterized protein PAN0_031c6229 [Moesziomyces antarcticus]GAK67999.1 conserved hypothetical protein [Moesziomyces antarcticus]SPO45294.1 uncharacterized protein PSANT_02980 [Moesziomyces antarcticus]